MVDCPLYGEAPMTRGQRTDCAVGPRALPVPLPLPSIFMRTHLRICRTWPLGPCPGKMQAPLLALLRTYEPRVFRLWVTEAALGWANDAVTADLGREPQRGSGREGREPGVTGRALESHRSAWFNPGPSANCLCSLGQFTSPLLSCSFFICSMRYYCRCLKIHRLFA